MSRHHLHESFKEMDGRLWAILRSMEDDTCTKEAIDGLLGTFESDYQSLYSHYNHLIKKLRRKTESNQGKDCSSPRSDSLDSDDFLWEKGRKHSSAEYNTYNKPASVYQESGISHPEYSKKKSHKASIGAESAEPKKRGNERSKHWMEKVNLNLELVRLRIRHMHLETQFLKIIEAKNQEINRKGENIEELKTELEMKDDEIRRLAENIGATEVNQRLTSRKLLVMEQIFSEKEESHRERVEKLLEDQKLLEEKNSSLSASIAAYEEALEKTAAEISDKVKETLMGIDNLGLKFEEEYGLFESRLNDITNEFSSVLKWINDHNNEKERMNKELSHLVVQLKEKEKLETELGHYEEEMKCLARAMQEREEKMVEMEREMREKDERILSMDEEKREAIRQLCIWIDHLHQDRVVDSKTRGVRGIIAACFQGA